MIDVLRDHIIVIFDDAEKVARCGEIQEAAFSAGFKWISGCTVPILTDTIKTLHFNSQGSLILTQQRQVNIDLGQELSIDFMISRLKEVASNGI